MFAVQYRINSLAEYTLLSRLKDVNSVDRNLLTSHKSADNNIVNNCINNFCAEQFILKKALNVNVKIMSSEWLLVKKQFVVYSEILLVSSSVLSVIRVSK